MLELATSPDGRWALARAGRQVRLHASGAGPAVGRLELASDDADLAIVHGPPNVVLAVTRANGTTRITLHPTPALEAATGIELPALASLATISGGRLVLLGSDRKQLVIVRATGRGLATHAVDLRDDPAELVVGIERDQLVVGRTRKLEIWDAVSGRALGRLAIELPPAPRTLGAAAGHLWVTRPGSDEIIVYRLSDRRPFQHPVGAPVQRVIAHPASPVLVVVTPRGLFRLHCQAHSVLAIESPWQAGVPTALAQLVVGDDIRLLGSCEGAGDGEAAPWQVPLAGAGWTRPPPAS